MKSILNAFLLCLLAISSLAQSKKQKTGDPLAGIDTLLNRILKDQQVAGFAVAVVKGDQIIYSKGFGYRDVESKKPVTPNTLFAIGSSTKSFTSALIGLQQKEGNLSFDGIATSYLPQLKFYNDNMNNQITVRDMMCHRTGLSRYDLSWFVFNTSNRDSIIQRVRYMEPTAPVRAKWQYNNFMFLAQGMIVEKLTGKTWEQNIKEKFFNPLEMSRSNTSILEFEKDNDASLPYTINDKGAIEKIDYYNIDGMGPAGSINSSANDMTHWLKVWINGGTYKGKEILPASYIREAASSQMVISGGLPEADKDIYLSNYGFGWMISSYRGHYMVEHGGNINGFSASVSFFPTDKIGIVVLTNQNTSNVPKIVYSSIADRLLELKNIDWNGRATKAKAEAKEREKAAKKTTESTQALHTKPSHPLKDYDGLFDHPAYGLINVSFKNDSLFAMMGKEKLLLRHYHYDVFSISSIDKKGKIDTAESDLRFNFISGQDGKIEGISLLLEQGIKPAIFTYKPKTVELSAETLESYIGSYGDKGMTKVYLKGKTLFVSVPGQPEYETISVGNDVFNFKNLKGFSLKFEKKEGVPKALSVSFIQPNGTFRQVRQN
ncbi:CubicO group peptidase, beta-lactamase class C family [Pedobacter terrae]|uniref:CubicO group peptidase, beta-lactamase class C family n=1 Tax=Pedobacter terrae TaxID=405671 RepID=A0A1G8CKQ0_9SPHI|nr:serine hydrolase [Pedobacter terrae]SDH45982.1 CubicO group peptidase, beta-lactamase class C family [Pedobacter terrae]